MLRRKYTFVLLMAILSLFLIGANAHASSIVKFCSEANCSAITVTFGGQTHSATLNCSNVLGFTGVPAGTYTLTAYGCGSQWSGTVSVNGTSTYNYALCSDSLGCCSTSCGDKFGTGSGWMCDGCDDPGGCLAEALLGYDAEDLGLLRQFRSDILLQSIAGTGLNALYNEHTSELKAIAESDPDLKARATDALLNNISLVDQCMSGIPVVLDGATLAEADALLAAFQEKAGAGLKADLEKLRQDLASGKLVQDICR